MSDSRKDRRDNRDGKKSKGNDGYRKGIGSNRRRGDGEDDSPYNDTDGKFEWRRYVK